MTKEEFEALIDKYISGNASEREQRMIDDFFAAQERKEPAHNEWLSESMWDRISHVAMPELEETADTPRRFPVVWLTACLVLLVVGGFGYMYLSGSFASTAAERKWITLDAPYGQKSIVALPDGTRIFLNGGGVLSYPEVFLTDKREVKLSGEAFFEVAKNPEQPFIVTAGGVVTKVLGTSFNIQAFPHHKVSVTVATGSVQVEIGSGDKKAEMPQRAILAPNDQAVYHPANGGFTVSEVDLEKYLAWKDNTLFFQDTSLEDVAATLERWYNVTVIFDNDLIKGCRINGKYADQSLESVLQSIGYMYKIEFEFRSNNVIHLKGNGCRDRVVNSS